MSTVTVIPVYSCAHMCVMKVILIVISACEQRFFTVEHILCTCAKCKHYLFISWTLQLYHHSPKRSIV